MVQPVASSSNNVSQAVARALQSNQNSEGGGEARAERQKQDGEAAKEQRARSRERSQRTKKELPQSFKQRMSLGIIPETDDMFIKVVDTQKGETVDVRPSVSLLKSNLVVNEVVGKFVDRNA